MGWNAGVENCHPDRSAPGERSGGTRPVHVTGPRSAGRKWIALAMLVALAGLAVKTIDPGRVRSVVLLLLVFFALRIVLTASASR
jgi:hypothetical protein